MTQGIDNSHLPPVGTLLLLHADRKFGVVVHPVTLDVSVDGQSIYRHDIKFHTTHLYDGPCVVLVSTTPYTMIACVGPPSPHCLYAPDPRGIYTMVMSHEGQLWILFSRSLYLPATRDYHH